MTATRKRALTETPAPLAALADRPRVLAVDDDERNLLAIGEVLGSVTEVVTARSGEEALRLLLKEEFAVILLDVLMPGLDGYETAALIRQREQSKRTPIIFLTAINKEQGHLLRGYDAGAVDFVFKPFDPLMLRSKVSVFVDLFEKTREVREKAEHEQQLLQENLRANAGLLEAERALRRSEERAETVLQSLPVCFHARAARSPFGARFVSAGVERLTGFAPHFFTDDPEFGLSRVHPDDLARLTGALTDVHRTGSYSCEFRWRCADGGYRHFLDQGVISRDGDASENEAGEPEILGTLLDITERRELESRLMLADRLEAIGKLTGGVAHDFNNLLATILSGLNLIERRSKLDEGAAHILDMTRRSAQQGAELVNRMLAFSRRQSLRPEATALTSLAEPMTGLVGPVLGGLVRFEWQVEPSTWNVHVDGAQLELALMNLIFNARDAIESTGTITIRAENRTVRADTPDLAAGDYVALIVADTGAGMPAEIVAKVIEPFFTTKPPGKGTGLGLSTAYGFARQSGGTLRIQSIEGHGTTIEIWLPRTLETPIAATPHAPAEAVEKSARQGFSSILLVDDSGSLRELMAQMLGDRGFDVATAAGGAEALAMIEKQPQRFDLIITDFAMPMVSGIDVVRFARNVRADWPALIVTGFADSAALAEGPDDVPVLTKPFSEAALLEAIAGLGSRSAAAG